jgi:hypothetical protein
MTFTIEWYHFMFLAWILILINQIQLFKRIKGVESLAIAILTGEVQYDPETKEIIIIEQDEED